MSLYVIFKMTCEVDVIITLGLWLRESGTWAAHRLLENLFFFLIYLFNLFILAALGLFCCTRAFSSCGERGLLFVAVHGLLIAVASLVAEHGL